MSEPDKAAPLLHEDKEQGASTEDADEETQSLSSKFEDIKKRISEVEEEMLNSQVKEKMDLIQVKEKLDHIQKSIQEKSQLKPSHQPKETKSPDHHPLCQEWEKLGIENKVLESDAMLSLTASFHCTSSCCSHQVKMCSLFLSVFPLYSVIEKKPLIYWWMGEGVVIKTKDETAEQVGEQVFQELLDHGFIRPSSSENKSLSVKSFTVDPWIHRMLIKVTNENSFLEFNQEWTPCNGKRRAFLNGERNADALNPEDVLTVFNLKEKNLRMKQEWLAKLKKVDVLHMGRWQHSVTHHIEVENQTLLDKLGSQKHLKYLSLRGISRIETLPASISKLISLQILDLRACHNLEKLPRGISKLKNLTHLDVSECYLLESMPKGLEHLLALQVLKGFVIGKAELKNTGKISDLEKLTSLRKLSIRVGGETEKQDNARQPDDRFARLDKLSSLCILTISFGKVPLPQEDSFSLPTNLKKLDLRCVPFDALPEWLRPSKLPLNLGKLYITGGELKSLKHQDEGHNWKGKFLRLKYLENLKIEEGELDRLFPECTFEKKP